MPKIPNPLFVSKRGPHGVGKQMIGCKYVHISAIDVLPKQEKDLFEKAHNIIGTLPENTDAIVKICLKDGRVSFIESPDWNISSEPSIGSTKGVKELYSDHPTLYKRGPSKDPQIYHHKWMFVKDDYRGFNVDESMKWSEYWENHPEVLRLTNDKSEKFRSKIGNKSYWEEKVLSKIK